MGSNASSQTNLALCLKALVSPNDDHDDYSCQNENLKLPPIGSTAPASASACISRSLFNNDDDDDDDEHD